MSRVTRCPNCETLFKVVPDQLRLSQGWVRCGNCSAVFDASEQMQHAQAHDSATARETGSTQPVWSLLLEDAPPAPTHEAPAENIHQLTEYSTPPQNSNADKEEYSQSEGIAFEPVTTTVVLTEASFISDAQEAFDAEAASADWTVAGPVAPSTRKDAQETAPPEPANQLSGTPANLHQAPLTDSWASPEQHIAAPTGTDTSATRGMHPDEERETPATPKPAAKEISPSLAAVPAVPSLLKKASADTVPESIEEEDNAPPQPDPSAAPAPPIRGKSRSLRKKSSRRPAEAPDQAAPLASQQEQRTEQSEPNHDLSFVKQAKRRQFWRKSWVRAGLAMLAMALATGLGLNWVHRERDWLAAAYPDAKPLLERLCGHLQCRIRPYQKLESIAIQNSEFNRLPTGEFQLSLSLRNLDQLTLATPSLALTLTDALDRTIAQQTLSPAQLKAPAQLLANRDWSGNTIIHLDRKTNAAQISGYRLQAFYP